MKDADGNELKVGDLVTSLHDAMKAELAKARDEATREQLERDCKAQCVMCANGLGLKRVIPREMGGSFAYWMHTTAFCEAWRIHEADYQRREREKGGSGGAGRTVTR